MPAPFLARVSAAAVRHPVESVERLRGRLDARAHHRDMSRLAGAATRVPVAEPVADPARELHAVLGLPWPCPESAAFETVWDEIRSDLTAAGARIGLASYRGWNDGDRAMAEAMWCLVIHSRPQQMVETGVAHGLTSRVVLEAMRRNDSGHLWSIDLPAIDPALHGEIGVAVPERLTARWTYVRGTSRRALPRTIARLDQLDLFVHDSLHTTRNTRFELITVWPSLRPGGVTVVDDIDRNLAFDDVVAEVRPRASFTARHTLGDGRWGVLVKEG